MAVPKNNLPLYTFTLDEAINSDFKNYGNTDVRGDLSRENKPFIYPGPFSRNISETKDNQRITRGFMRSIIMDSSISAHFGANTKGNLRLNFQFNPEYIERRVDQSVGAVNPLLQNPANLTQAVPGSATFNFTMMFNREEEVARTPLEKFVIDADNPEGALKNPGIVGVMHDLAIFDKIIGQGITQELVDVITAYTRQQAVAENKAAVNADGTPKQDEDGKDIVPRKYDETTNKVLKDSLTSNFGNSAFLNPMPVRIVFSDLFMVEGLITSSAVAFQKFSQNMVPTICQVNCTVMALYVGFAKQKAYLTDSLTNWAQAEAEGVIKAAAATDAASIALKQSLVTLNLGVNIKGFQSDENKLTVPGDNTIGMKKFSTSSNPSLANLYLETALYYPGNQNGINDYVTLPQWFNAFAASSATLGIMKNTANTEFVGDDVSGAFGKTRLPITIYIETTDKEFNNVKSTFTARIIDTVTRQTKETVSSDNSNNWVPVNNEDLRFGARPKNSKGNFMFKNTFYIDPKDVVNVKGTIPSNNRCQLAISINFYKTLPDDILARHTYQADFYYNGIDPFFYRNDESNELTQTQSNVALVNKQKVNFVLGNKPTGN